MEIKKAVITAAGKTQRTLPLQTLVDSDGVTKTALRILIEEILATGIEEIRFVEQTTPLGYGHAVFCAQEFVGNRPFLLLVGDHLYVSGGKKRCAQQLIDIAAAENCSVSAVQATHESKLPYYGAIGGRLVAARKGLYEISQVLEKPTPTEAEQKLIVPGLRAGHYLCFFGMHVLTPAVMAMLAQEVSQASNRGVHLTTALAHLAQRERYLACELQGHRYDVGVKYGFLTAQLALALDGQDRDEVLGGLVELLARRG